MKTSLLFLALLAIPGGAAGAPLGAPPGLESGLEALRQGRFQQAREVFARLSTQEPEAPEGPFFEGFEIWWRLLGRPRHQKQLRLRMEERLAEAGRRALLLESSGSPESRERGMILRGVALLLEAQSRAARGAHMRAASSARKGHRVLAAVLRQDPDSADALFAMGAYDYYADNLPLLVKGLRFLLLIPGGDEDRGISRLEAAAAHSELFGTEALMLLAHIFSGAHEHDYRRSLGYLEEAVARHPRSPLIGLAYADMLFDLGRLHEAAAQARGALQAAAARSGYPDELARVAAYRMAACTLNLHDPLGALRMIEESLERMPPVSLRGKNRWLRLLAAAAGEAGRPERADVWIERLGLPDRKAASIRKRLLARRADAVAAPRARALADLAAGRSLEAQRRLEALLEQNPKQCRLHYDLGRLLQQEGRLADAKPHLQIAAEVCRPAVAGWALLRLGWDLEQSGHRDLALRHYRRAARMKRFAFRVGARDRVAHPATAPPEG